MDKHRNINTWWRVDFLKDTSIATKMTSDAGYAIPQHFLIANCDRANWNETT